MDAETRIRISEIESGAGYAYRRQKQKRANETEIEMGKGKNTGNSSENLFESFLRVYIMYLDFLSFNISVYYFNYPLFN